MFSYAPGVAGVALMLRERLKTGGRAPAGASAPALGVGGTGSADARGCHADVHTALDLQVHDGAVGRCPGRLEYLIGSVRSSRWS